MGITLNKSAKILTGLKIGKWRVVNLSHKSKRKIMKDWADELGVSIQILSGRINDKGWSIERALTQKPRKRSQN